MKQLYFSTFLLFISLPLFTQASTIIDHNCRDIEEIPASWIDSVKNNIKLHYAHTSHGGQLITGLDMILSENQEYAYDRGRSELPDFDNVLSIFDGQISTGYVSPDDYWATHDGMNETRTILEQNPSLNVSGWTWCGQLSSYSASSVQAYLDSINLLSKEFPQVDFILFTGHLDGTGDEGVLQRNNEMIRQYAVQHAFYMYDFADIEQWDPNGIYYEDGTDACEWCDNWCYSNPQECPSCSSCNHSHCYNCYLKGQALWWLLARIAGWCGPEQEYVDTIPPSSPDSLSVNILSESEIELHWSESADNIGVEAYIIYRDGVMQDTIQQNLFLDHLSEQSNVNYEVAALDSSGNRSQLTEPLQVNMVDYLKSYMKTMYPGYNWLSFNRHRSNMYIDSILAENISEGYYIKNQYASASYYEDEGWFGNLDSLTVTSSYHMMVIDTCTIKYKGVIPIPNRHPISLQQGWNWIGNILDKPMPIDSVFASLTIDQFDYIKDQTSSARYYSGYGWFGTMNTLVPGNGYMFKVQSPDTLIFPAVGDYDSTAELPKSNIDMNSEAFIFRQYTGSIAATIGGDLNDFMTEHDTLYALIDGEPAGKVHAIYFDPGNQYVFPLLIHSESEEGVFVNFKYYSHQRGKKFSCQERITFDKDMILADAFSPTFLSTAEVNGFNDINSSLHGVRVYPNPFRESIHIRYEQNEPNSLLIQLIDLQGKLLKSEISVPAVSSDFPLKIVLNNLSKGMYILKIQDKSTVWREMIMRE